VQKTAPIDARDWRCLWRLEKHAIKADIAPTQAAPWLLTYLSGTFNMLQAYMPILLSIHLLICLFLIGAILLQRSEGGGALGMGGGPTSMMSGRSATTFITRTTTILAGAFFVTSLALTIIGGQGARAPTSVMDDGSTKGGLPTKSIDLSAPKAPVNAIAPAPGDIPASSPTAPVPNPFAPAPAKTEKAADQPAQKTAQEKK
jgi:preprotein translocase subunit SecG